MRLLNADILAGNVARQWMLIAASRDVGERWHWIPDFLNEVQGANVSFHRYFYDLSSSNWNKLSIVCFIIFEINIIVELYTPYPDGATSGGEEFTERSPNFLNYVQHIFPGKGKIFWGETKPLRPS